MIIAIYFCSISFKSVIIYTRDSGRKIQFRKHWYKSIRQGREYVCEIGKTSANGVAVDVEDVIDADCSIRMSKTRQMNFPPLASSMCVRKEGDFFYVAIFSSHRCEILPLFPVCCIIALFSTRTNLFMALYIHADLLYNLTLPFVFFQPRCTDLLSRLCILSREI